MVNLVFVILKDILGISLEIQWLGLCIVTALAQVLSLVRELRSCKSCGMVKKKVYSQIETYTFIKPKSQSVSQFSCSVVSDSLRPHESQHTRPPCPSPTSGVHSNSCPSSQ